LKVELALVGIVLAAFIGWFVGTLLEHPPGLGGLPVIEALIGAMIALDILILGEALKSKS